jgi:hypothetical protein
MFNIFTFAVYVTFWTQMARTPINLDLQLCIREYSYDPSTTIAFNQPYASPSKSAFATVKSPTVAGNSSNTTQLLVFLKYFDQSNNFLGVYSILIPKGLVGPLLIGRLKTYTLMWPQILIRLPLSKSSSNNVNFRNHDDKIWKFKQTEWVSDRCDHVENKLIFNEMMIRSALY